jgi:hypothetical protein
MNELPRSSPGCGGAPKRTGSGRAKLREEDDLEAVLVPSCDVTVQKANSSSSSNNQKATCSREPVQMHRDVWSAKGQISRRLMKNKNCLSRPRLEPMVVALLRFHIRQTLTLIPSQHPRKVCGYKSVRIQVQINDAPASKPQEAPEVLAE